jgi:hypothetical protein
VLDPIEDGRDILYKIEIHKDVSKSSHLLDVSLILSGSLLPINTANAIFLIKNSFEAIFDLPQKNLILWCI